LIARLILLFAVLLMPLGMAAAPASTPHRLMSADMPMQHCPDQTPAHDSKGALAQCTMACAAALPAAMASADLPHLLAGESSNRSVSLVLHGLHPETATPPPKRS
jgi:hypothetical protein